MPANDEFEGDALDECRWTEIFNRNDEGMSVGDGELTLRTLEGELSNDECSVQNLFLQETNDSDWQATTKLTFDPPAEGQQAGLVIWGHDAQQLREARLRPQGERDQQRLDRVPKTTNGETDFGDVELRPATTPGR